jgi:hypothetical protein
MAALRAKAFAGLIFTLFKVDFNLALLALFFKVRNFISGDQF